MLIYGEIDVAAAEGKLQAVHKIQTALSLCTVQGITISTIAWLCITTEMSSIL
jgi:hypothetical protein